MHLNESNKMSGDIDENEMHHGMQISTSESNRRAYQSKTRVKVKIISQQRPSNKLKIHGEVTKEIICLRAPTPSDIDLPISSEVESNSVPQDFSCHKIISFLPSYDSLSDCSQQNTSDHAIQSDAGQKNCMQNVLLMDMQGDEEKGTINSNIRKKRKAPVSYSKDKKNSDSTKRLRKISLNGDDEEQGRGHRHLKRPQHKVLGFMEDHAEFGSDFGETSRCQGSSVASVLESTVDGSIIKGARRVSRSSRITRAELATRIDSAIKIGDVDKDPLKILDEWGLKTELHKYKCSSCEKISCHRVDIEDHIDEFKGTSHSDAVVEVLLGNQALGRNCTLCDVRLSRTEYFNHMREEHKEVFPLRCGYCAFQGQDYNQLRHHIQKKHKTSDFDIIDMTLSQDANGSSKRKKTKYCERLSDEEAEEDGTLEQPFTCPLCSKGLKTLRNLKKHVMKHSREKKQCMLCPFTTNFPTQIRSHYSRKHPDETPKWKKIVVAKGGSDALVEDASPILKMVSRKYGVRKPKEKNWVRQYRCPHCSYTCNFNSSYNRHLRVHEGVKPFKCGHCSFHGREAYVVKKHSMKMHKGKKILIENGKMFKAPYRYAKRLKEEPVEWDGSSEAGKKINKKSSKSSDGLCLNIKVEEQSEELNRSNIVMPSSNLQAGRRPISKKMAKIKSQEDQDEGNSHQSKDSSIYQCLVLSSGKDSSSCSGNEVEGKTDSASPPSAHSSDDCKKNVVIERSEDNECRIPSSKSGRHADSTSKLSRPVAHMQTQEHRNNVDEPLLEIVHVKDIPEPKDAVVECSSMQQDIIHTIKVKTLTDELESTVESPKMKEDIFEEGKSSCMQIHCDNSRTLPAIELSSSDVTDLDSSSFPSSNHEAVVINLYANESDSPRELINHNSTERLEDSSILREKICSTNDHDDRPLNLIVSEKRKSLSTLQESSNNDIQLVKCSEKSVETNENKLDGKSSTLEKSLDPPPERLETTLNSHITFLSDSLAQRVSNRISAPPGVMTRDLLGLDYSNSDYFSSDKVRTMMIKKKGGLVTCTECGVTTTYRAFYKHAKKHFNIKPFRCGHCSYRSIEKSKIRVHNAFCHPQKPCVILKLSPDSAKVVDATHQPTPSKTSGDSASLPKIARNAKLENGIKDLKREQKKNPTSSTKSNKITLFQCPICCKFMKNHSPSIRRHLYSHYNYKPYKCGYCAFTAIGQTEIRAHHVTHGSLNPPKIEPLDAPMPFALTNYITDYLGQQRGNKRANKKKEASNLNHLDIDENPKDVMWHELEDLTTINLNIEDPSQGNLGTDNDPELESMGVGNCSFQQTPGSVQFSPAEPHFTVKVLESDGQGSSGLLSDLSQLDLNVASETSAGDRVCVVYIIPN